MGHDDGHRAIPLGGGEGRRCRVARVGAARMNTAAAWARWGAVGGAGVARGRGAHEHGRGVGPLGGRCRVARVGAARMNTAALRSRWGAVGGAAAAPPTL
jgi:hypothetical protein